MSCIGGKDSCQGDSGGPVWSDGARVGAASSGLGCAFPTQYGLYARVAGAVLRGWIERTLPPPSAAPSPSPSPSPAPGAGTPPSTAVPVSLRVSRVTGSAGHRRAILTVRTSGPVTSVRATLRAGGRTIGSARRTRLARGTTRITVRLRRAARSVSVAVNARDGQGRAVRATRRATLPR